MRLSPFEPAYDDHWLNDAPLYGRSGLRDPRGSCSFEVFPARNDDDLSDCYRISRNEDDCDWSEIGFDVPKATSRGDHVMMINTHDRPTLQWYSLEEFEDRFLYDPLNPPRPRGLDPDTWKRSAKSRVWGQDDPSTRMTKDRRTLLTRIARLWNGEVVCGVHLLADKCPTIKHVTHGNRNSVERVFREVKRRTNQFSNCFSHAEQIPSKIGFKLSLLHGISLSEHYPLRQYHQND